MFRYKHSAEHWQLMSDKKRAELEPVIASLKPFADEGRFDIDLVKFIIRTHRRYADTILLIYSGLLHANHFVDESHECLKTLCRCYDEGVLDNKPHYKARAFLTYAATRASEDIINNRQQEDFHFIVTNIRKAIDLDENYREAKLSLCLAFAKYKMFNLAINYFKKLLKDHSDYPEAYHNYAICLREAGQKELSMQVREVLIDKYPHEFKSLFLYALDVGSVLGDYVKQIQILQETLSLIDATDSPDSNMQAFKVYLALGIAYNNIGELEESKEAYQMADEINPKNAVVKSAKAHLKQNRGETGHKHPGKMAAKISKEFNQAIQLDHARFDRNHSTVPQASPSVFLVDRQPSLRSLSNYELAVLDECIYEYEELKEIPADLTEEITTRTMLPVASPIETKQASPSIVELTFKAKNLRDECLNLMLEISHLCKVYEKELDKKASDQLKLANNLFEHGNHDAAQAELLGVLQDLKNSQPTKEQRRVTAAGLTLALEASELKPKSAPQISIESKQETKQKIQKKKNPATLFASSKPLPQDRLSPISLTVLCLSLSAAALLLYALYCQLYSSPEQTQRFKMRY